ncbi:TOMM precursor leader peptide-binding protein [Crossiella cryophila]|uniref:Bacteriocin biosynthesis cyclodehydratase domain-containing protein n=1 Tax=Crossiella cryophila TaxID=43355 RepID=A0A7W7CG23_9PSEU|nr:TOMM precursor leader peptide-binding protein [Crossiella cryophila]MBB4680445.1 bacteriocin biosynthesis cyclodehydratase domain-containing protein [Crossiella cryophila]
MKRSVSVIGHSPDVVELRSGVWNAESYTLTDHAGSNTLFTLVSSLDGTRSRGEIAKQAGVPRAEVEALVDHLDQLNLIEEQSASALEAYLDRVDTLTSDLAGATVDTPIHLVGDHDLGARILAELGPAGAGEQAGIVPATDPAWQAVLDLERAGATDGMALAEAAEAARQWQGDLVLLAETTVNPLRLRALNRLSAEVGFPWLHSAVDGPFLLIGPTILPRRSACFECFETRVSMNLREGSAYQRYKNALTEGSVRLGSPPVFGPLLGLLAAHVALEAVNYLHTGTTFTVEKCLSVYLPTMEMGYHEVLRLPGCAGCGPVVERDDASLYFDARAWIGEGA